MIRVSLLVWLLLTATMLTPSRACAQVQEMQQLILNIEKLAELKKILQSMYDGYQLITNGYNKVKAITEGNYKIHQVFLDGLYQVSPSVRKYYRVADIISYQLDIIKSTKQHTNLFRSSGVFSVERLDHISNVFKRVVDDSIQNLDELTMILTANKLRMSDDERLENIDRLYENVQKQSRFLRAFNNQQKQVAIQQLKQRSELRTIGDLHGLN
jgi:hypothetical protein